MTPNARFKELLQDIEPSPTTKSNASAAHNRLRSLLKNDETFGSSFVSSFLSGSYKRDTAIRPRIKNSSLDRPDIDICVVTNYTLNDSPSAVIDNVHAALNRHYTPTNRQGRSVSVSTSIADMDVVPLIDPLGDETYYIPDREAETWIRTNPPGHTQWTIDTNSEMEDRFKPLVKMFKWWRRESPTISKRPKGFTLEVILSQCLSSNESHYGELFVSSLEKLVDLYQPYIDMKQVPVIEDPSMPGNNILAGISFNAFEGFFNKASSHASIGRETLSLEDQDEATDLWRQVFGDRFPKAPNNRNESLLGAASLSTPSLVFPNEPVTPPKKPAGFA